MNVKDDSTRQERGDSVDARQLKYFLAVVDNGGFVRAADALHISQPSLSQTISALERQLQVSLFHRVGRGVVLSTAGEILVEHARTVVRDLDVAKSVIDAHKGLRSGRLDITTMPSPGVEPLSTMIATFLTDHPAVTLNVEAAFTVDEVLEQVRSGRTEVGLVGTREPLRVSGVNVLALKPQTMTLIVNPGDDAFAGYNSVASADLAGRRLIVSHPGSLMRSIVDEMVSSGIDIRVVAEVAHRQSIIQLVLCEVGDAVMPSAWQPMARRLGLRALPLQPLQTLRLAMVSRQTRLTATASAFVETARTFSASHRPIL
jgi:DNA-binding transcriptional LysR family regulator